MNITRVPLASLVPDPANARLHPERNLQSIIDSLRRFGQAEPLVVQAGTSRIIAGNGRYAAMKVLGHTECDVVVLPVDDLTATALGIAMNRTADLAEWDEPALAQLLQSLQAEDALDGVGFTSDELSELLAGLTNEVPDVPQDDAPGLAADAVSRTGDVWLLGRHRLMCGDSSSAEDVDRLLAGAPIHLVNTDPPYNVKVEPRSNNAIAAGLSSFTSTHHQGLDLARHPGKAKPTHERLRAKDRPLANDFLPEEEFALMLRKWFGNAARVLLPGRAFYAWGGYANLANYPPALAESELYFSQAIVWDKEHPVLTRKDFMGAFELCFYGWKEGAAHQFYGPANVADLWNVKKMHHTQTVHLCLHPDALVLTEAGYRPINSILPGERVFSGDGTFHRVTNVSSHPYKAEHMYRIKARGGGETTEASDNHPFLIWRPTRRGAAITGGDVAWVRADEVKRGDYTMTPILEQPASDPFPERDEGYWFLFGLYLAQGTLQKAGYGANRYPSFHLHKKRQDLVARIQEKWGSAKEYDPNDYGEPSQGLTVMAFDPAAGAEFERLGGRLSHAKRMAPVVFQLPRAKRLAVFQGWLNGDGCRVHDRSYWQGNTVSHDLAAHLCLLAESVGYRANMYAYDPPEELGGIGGRAFKTRRRVYQLYFYERREAKRGSPLRIRHEGREYSLRRVKRIERVPYVGDVWNLSVDGHPSFQTAVGLSHNTEKPVELAVRAMSYSSREGEHVLDLFGGSGSTMAAAEQTGRKAFLMELDPLYCDVIVQRLQKLTKEPARLESSGQSFAAVAKERGVTLELVVP